MKKKALSILLASAMLASLTACSSSEKSTETTATGGVQATQSFSDGATFKVAVVQLMDHASLDEIRLAVEAELDAKAKELGIEINYTEFNGQNDPTILNQIGTQVVSDGYDCIIPIATLAAQCMQAATADTQTPVIFAAISDPVSAGLVESLEAPGANVTGTSDYLNSGIILDMMLAANPDIKNVGLLYNKSEDSSKVPIEDAKKYLDEKKISYVEKTGTTNDEISMAVDSMLDQVDAIFTPTDNTVAGAELAIADKMAEAKVPHYTGADSFVRNGAFATCGVNYKDLGSVTADMAVDILGGAVPSTYAVHVMDGDIITVNTETAKKLGMDYSCFKSMCTTLTEVTTSEE